MNEACVSPADLFVERLRQLVAGAGFAAVAAEGVAPFAAEGDTVLLLTEDPVRSPESWDMAVVLPEALKSVPPRLRAGVADPAASREIARDFAITVLPALLFQRDGAYVGAIEGMRDWLPLVEGLRAMLAAPVRRRPGVGIPVRGAGASSCH